MLQGNGGTATEERMTNLAVSDSDVAGLVKAAQDRLGLEFMVGDIYFCSYYATRARRKPAFSF